MKERTIDLILLVAIIPVIFMIGLNFICVGWDEGSMRGSCLLPQLNNIYDFGMMIFLMSGFMPFITLPIIIFILILYVKSSIYKIFSWKTNKRSPFYQKPFSFILWLTYTIMLLGISIASFIYFWFIPIILYFSIKNGVIKKINSNV